MKLLWYILRWDLLTRTAKTFPIFYVNLLKIATTSSKLHADVTLKLNWQGYAVLMIGTTDMNRKYHHMGVAVTRGETSSDYEFLFSSIKIGLAKVGLPAYDPDVLISDAAGAIHNGYKHVFGSSKIVMCWYIICNVKHKCVEKKN